MKKIITILVCGIMLIGITGCGSDELISDEPIEEKETDVLGEHGEVMLTVHRGNKDCVQVSLSLYDDGNYELFTAYEMVNNDESQNMMLQYSKSIKGTYNYDINKILENSVDANDKSYSMDDLPEYELYTGDGHYYTVEKGQTNESLNEFLKQINVNLDACAEADSVK